MPQFDFTTFCLQSITISLGFAIFYFLYVKFILTSVYSTLRLREKILFSAVKLNKTIRSSSIVESILSKI